MRGRPAIVTASEAARRAGITPTTVFNWIRAGLLRSAHRAGGVTLLSLDEVYEVARRRRRLSRRRTVGEAADSR